MKLTVVDSERCIGCQDCMFACVRRQGDAGLSRACLGVRSIGGMERGFTVIVCRACPDAPCAKVCPTRALEPRNGGGVRLDRNLCIGCGLCKDICLCGAIFWDGETNKPMICNHCGYCVKYCSHNVLKLIAAKGGNSAI